MQSIAHFWFGALISVRSPRQRQERFRLYLFCLITNPSSLYRR